MIFKNFINESKFKVGDIVKIVKFDGPSRNSAIPIGTEAKIVCFDKKGNLGLDFGKNISGHNLRTPMFDRDDLPEYFPILSGYNNSWWVTPECVAPKYTPSKHLKQLKFEAHEPGQEVYEQHNKYVVNVKSESESRLLQNWAFANGFIWAHGQVKNTYIHDPIKVYDTSGCIALNFKEKRIVYSGKKFFESTEWSDYNHRKTVYDLNEFFDVMEVDERIKIKPSKMKKEK